MRRAILGLVLVASSASAETVPLPLIVADGFSEAFCFYDGRGHGNFVTWTVPPRDGSPCPAALWWSLDRADTVPVSSQTPDGLDREALRAILDGGGT